jgi:sulfur-oxidizing protein SoxY
MDTLRRTLVAALALAVLKPMAVLAAWNEKAFGAKTAGDALKSLGVGEAAASKELTIDAPQIAENGAVVPIEVSSAIPGTTAISVVIEKNPFPLAARFEFKEGALPFVKVNVKMGETSDIRAIAEAGGRHYSATREVKVTIGGCGG